MTGKTRKILLLICLFLFLLIAPSVILYSQGYRFDFENKKLTQTGGLFVKAEPKQVEIYLNGKFNKKTDFFFGSALVENLLPKKYKTEIKKDGYFSWEKTLEVREKTVTEVKNLILFPKNLNFNNLSSGVENFWVSPDQKKIILMETSQTTTSLATTSSSTTTSTTTVESSEATTTWALKLYDLEKGIKSYLISEMEIDSHGAALIKAEFSDDSKEFYLDVGAKAKEQKKSFSLKIDRIPAQLREREIIPPSENIICSATQNQDTYELDKSGYLLKNGVKLNQSPFPVLSETEYNLEPFQNFLFLREGENLYLFSFNSKSFEKLFDKVNDLKISPNNQKLAIFSNSEIWVLFLAADGVKKAGEKLFLVRLSEKIDDVFWVNSDYLIFNSGNNIKIVELDDRDKIQVWDIANFPNPKIYFNPNNKKLYILSEDKLLISSPLF